LGGYIGRSTDWSTVRNPQAKEEEEEEKEDQLVFLEKAKSLVEHESVQSKQSKWLPRIRTIVSKRTRESVVLITNQGNSSATPIIDSPQVLS